MKKLFLLCFFLLTTSLLSRPSNDSSVDTTGGGDPCPEGMNVGEGVETEEQECNTVEKKALVIDAEGNLSEVPIQTIECK